MDIVYGISEAPLKLIEDIVLRDAPYTEIVTAQSTLTNEVGAIIFGQDWDPSGEEWQVTTWGDARPVAGILSESALWLRHISDGSNYHRGRASDSRKHYRESQKQQQRRHVASESRAFAQCLLYDVK